MKQKILLIYTGGTIGMMQDGKGVLRPVDFKKLKTFIPELEKINVQLESISFKKPMDSSNMNPSIWIDIVKLIQTNYLTYDGFVVLHGSDTMAYTASALSFMLENIKKPVILTGSQLPIGIIRTDGKENLITAIEIAASNHKGKSTINEVCIYFEYKLLRGNRSLKYNASHFDAFKTPNYPVLAEAGVHIEYNNNYLLKANTKKTVFHTQMDAAIAVLHLFPGILAENIDSITNSNAKVFIMLSYGSGNASTEKTFIESLKKIIKSGKHIVNVTQCLQGNVEQGKYETSTLLNDIGVISANDMTFEAAVAKAMFLLGNYSGSEFKKLFVQARAGEVSN